MQLAVTELGKSVEVVKILVEGAAKKRLVDLGFSLGCVITPLADNGGNLIVKVGESRVAINKGIAMRILVEITNKECGSHGLNLCDPKESAPEGGKCEQGEGPVCESCFAAN